jgi:hypothetical protein
LHPAADPEIRRVAGGDLIPLGPWFLPFRGVSTLRSFLPRRQIPSLPPSGEELALLSLLLSRSIQRNCVSLARSSSRGSVASGRTDWERSRLQGFHPSVESASLRRCFHLLARVASMGFSFCKKKLSVGSFAGLRRAPLGVAGFWFGAHPSFMSAPSAIQVRLRVPGRVAPSGLPSS